MKMSPTDIKAYPDCAKLLQQIRTRVTTKVLNAFFESCKADYLNGVDPAHIDRVAHMALMWDQAPAVSVHAGELRVPERGVIVPACGFTGYVSGAPPFYNLHSYLV